MHVHIAEAVGCDAFAGDVIPLKHATGKAHDMSVPVSLVSEALPTFAREAPEHAQAWGVAVGGLAKASALDRKTSAPTYLAVSAAGRLESGIPLQVQVAKDSGVSRDAA